MGLLLASSALRARLPTSMSNHGALTRMLNGNGNIRRAVSDKTVRGGGERARVHHFPAGQGGERFCSLSQPNPNNTKPVSTTTKNCTFISIFSLVLIKNYHKM